MRKFEKYGPVVEARIVRDPRTGSSRGFGFVVMQRDKDRDEAIYDLNGGEWDGRKLLVEKARNPLV